MLPTCRDSLLRVRDIRDSVDIRLWRLQRRVVISIMSGQVTQIQEQGLALIVRRDQVNGFVREQIRRILAVVVRHIQVSSHVVTEIVFDKVFHRVVVVVEVDAQVTEV